jgi:replicative DNA helicase
MTGYNPSSRDSERALLGCFLIDSSLIGTVDIEPVDFYDPQHRKYYEVMLRLGTDADFVTVSEQFNGGTDRGYLSGLLNEPASILNADLYAKAIKEAAYKRGVAYLLQDNYIELTKGNFDPGKLIAELTKSVNIDSGAVHISKYTHEYQTYALEREADPREVWGIPSGIIDFDRLTGGYHKRKMVLISGDPDTGKTIFVIQSAVGAAKAGYNVLVYELELTGQDMASRIISAERGIEERQVHRGKLGTSGMLSLEEGVKQVNDLPIYMSEKTDWSTTKLRADVARMKTQLGCVDLVVLDSLVRLTDAPYSNVWENDTWKSGMVRNMAKDLDVAVLTVHNKIKSDGRPRMKDLRGGFDVPYQADEVYFLVESDDELDWGKPRRLIPDKQRYGGPQKWIDLVIPNDRPTLVALTQ